MKQRQWVYIVQVGNDGPVKIGTAMDVAQRMSQLQWASVELLHLRAVIPGGMDVEKRLHRELSRHRLRGEWFQMCDEIGQIIATADAGDFPGKLTKRHVGERMPPDKACVIWADQSLDGRAALEKMPGWSYYQALAQFGPRSPGRELPRDRAVAMAKAKAKLHPGVKAHWHSPKMKHALKRWQQHWRDPEFSSARAAFEAMDADVQEEIGSLSTANKIFGPRKPGDPSAGGRGKKRKRKR